MLLISYIRVWLKVHTPPIDVNVTNEVDSIRRIGVVLRVGYRYPQGVRC